MPKSQKLLFVSLHKFCSRARRQHTRYIERAIFSRFVSARRRRARSSSSSEFLTLIWIGYTPRGRFFLSHRSGQSRRRDIISRDGARAHFPRAFAAALRRRFNEARARTHTHTAQKTERTNEPPLKQPQIDDDTRYHHHHHAEKVHQIQVQTDDVKAKVQNHS